MRRIHVIYHNTRDGIVPRWNFMPTRGHGGGWHDYPDDIFDMDIVEEMPNSGLVYSRLEDVPQGDPWIYELRNYYDLNMYARNSSEILSHFLSVPRLLSDLLAGYGYILFNDRREGFIDGWFVSKLCDAWAAHGIPQDRVIYATGAFNAAGILPARGTSMRPLVIRQCELVSHRHLERYDYPERDALPDRRFLCFNRKIEHREYRMQLLSLVSQRGLLPHFHYGVGVEATMEHVLSRIEQIDEPSRWRTLETIRGMMDGLPMELDTNRWDVNLAFQHQPDQVGGFYMRSGISLVPETLFYGDEVFFSEKTMHAVRYLHPFIVASTQGTLAQLRDLGYETWSEWWDEGYDAIADHHARMEAVVDIVERIANWSQARWEGFLRDSRPICLRNRDRLYRFADEVSYADQLAGLWPDHL